MEKIDNFIELISNKELIDKVELLLNTYDVFNCGKIYLSSLFIMYFPQFNFNFEVDDNSYAVHPLYVSAGKLLFGNNENIHEHIEKYEIELEKWKQEDIKQKCNNIEFMKDKIILKNDNNFDIDKCYEIQFKILNIAKDYFEKKKIK